MFVPAGPGPATAEPGVFSQPGAALASAGAQASAPFQAWAAQFGEAKRQSDAANLVATGYQQLGDARIRASLIPYPMQAMAQYEAEAAKITKATVGQSADPLVQEYVGNRLGMQTAVDTQAVHQGAFRQWQSKQAGDLQNRLVTYQQQYALAPTPAARANVLDQIHQDIAGVIAAHGLDPGQGEALERNARQNADLAAAKEFAVQNPIQAERVLQDPTQYLKLFPNLTPDAAGSLAQTTMFKAWHEEGMAAAAQAHADMMAARDARNTEIATESQLLVGINTGQITSAGPLVDALRNRQLSPAGFDALQTAMIRKEGGNDNPTAVLDLYQKAGRGTLTPDDVNHALAAGDVSGRTAVGLQKYLNAENASQRQHSVSESMTMLHIAFGAKALDAGMDPYDQGKAAAAAALLGADEEFVRRVNAGEPPRAVAADILAREAPVLPQPSLGTLDVKTSTAADVKALAAQEIAAHAAGKLPDTQFRQDIIVLDAWLERVSMPHVTAPRAPAAPPVPRAAAPGPVSAALLAAPPTPPP